MRHRFILSDLAWILASLVLLLAVFSRLDLDIFFSSDALYLPSIYRDLAEQHSLAGWHFNPAPNFFPDMGFYFLLMACFGGNFLVASFAFAVAQYFAILLLMRFIFRLVLPQAPLWHFQLTAVLLSLSLLELLFITRDPYFSFYLVSNAYHTGAFLMGLACLALTLRYLRGPKRSILYWLFALISLCVLSDKLFIVLYCIPVLLTTACLCRATGWKATARLAFVNAAGVFMGLFLFNNIDKKMPVHFDKPNTLLNLANSKASLLVFLIQVRDYFSQLSFRSLTLYLLAAAFIAGGVVCARVMKRKEHVALRAFMVFFVTYCAVVTATPILNGSYTGNDCQRYNIYPVYMAALGIPVMIAYALGQRFNAGRKNAAPWLAAGLSVALLCMAGWSLDAKGLKTYFTYYPDIARKVDEIAARERLSNGVAEYWKAKRITMFSKRGVKVRAVFEDLAVWDHVANERWFFGPGVRYDFVLLNDFRDTTRYQPYVCPLKWIEEDGLSLVKTSPFRYNRDLGGNLPLNILDSD